MNNSLRTINEATERLWLEIEDQVARPIAWTASAVKPAHPTEPRLSPSHWSDAQIQADIDEEPKNPLRRWRWA